jgi:hypothetical protein
VFDGRDDAFDVGNLRNIGGDPDATIPIIAAAASIVS